LPSTSGPLLVSAEGVEYGYRRDGAGRADEGWPHSISEAMREDGHDPLTLARASETEISVTEVSGVPAWDLEGDTSGRATVVVELMAALAGRA
jgi:hypothetical protein